MIEQQKPGTCPSGHAVQSAKKFCTTCGEPMPEVIHAAPVAPVAANSEPAGDTLSRRRHPAKLLVVLGAVVVLGGGAAAFAATQGSHDAARTTSTQASTSTTQASPDSEKKGSLPMVLASDGLGAAHFGEPTATVIPQLTDLLGPPDKDESLAACPSLVADRRVEWADLALLFGNDASGKSVFVGWAYGPPSANNKPSLGIGNADRITSGSTVAQLKSAYGIRLALTPADDGLGFGASFVIDQSRPTQLNGSLSGTNDTDKIEHLYAGGSCGE